MMTIMSKKYRLKNTFTWALPEIALESQHLFQSDLVFPQKVLITYTTHSNQQK